MQVAELHGSIGRVQMGKGSEAKTSRETRKKALRYRRLHAEQVTKKCDQGLKLQ